MKPHREIERKFTVPIYDAEVWLVVSRKIEAKRKKFEHIFGPPPSDQNWDALCSHSGGHKFAMFFAANAIDATRIAHEVFHLTHRIMEWASCNFDAAHHEQGALLHGYLMDKVLSELGWLKRR